MVTDDELEELLTNCPTLYHMAEHRSWPSIEEFGLLSTSALLDQYGLSGPAREAIELQHRPTGVELNSKGLPPAIVRDQLPMSDAGLERCLPKHLSPSDWYITLNSKVFFWLSEDRLHRLTGAKAYREREHDVLEIDARSLVAAHRDRIWLCPINSGCTKPMPRQRDETTFARISDYDYKYWRSRRSRKERVVELAIDYSVQDISDHVTRVVSKKGAKVLEVIA